MRQSTGTAAVCAADRGRFTGISGFAEFASENLLTVEKFRVLRSQAGNQKTVVRDKD